MSFKQIKLRSDFPHLLQQFHDQMVFDSFQKHEIQLVYLDELYASVNNHIERFLTSCTFYFIRSTKGKLFCSLITWLLKLSFEPILMSPS